jgi:NAD(P)-dependent dehydrogenase (short-subunit alcohol dehydrogenase family)
VNDSITFAGEVALVTGSGRRLGAKKARELVARAATVVAHDAEVAAGAMRLERTRPGSSAYAVPPGETIADRWAGIEGAVAG